MLVIDDEAGLVEFIRRVLELKGYAVLTEHDGPRAVEVFEREQPQIVLIDVDLGYSKFDGMEVLKRIKAKESRAVCLMLSRVTDESARKRAKELGAAKYLLKPLDTKSLTAAVNQAARLIERR